MKKEIQENNSKNLKEITKRQEHVESKLDQILELLSKSQNPDQLQN